jgi:hypothetical protein
MTDIERRLKSARERWEDVAGYRLKIRRPLALELADIGGGSEFRTRAEIVERFVVDWELTEQQLFPGVGGEDRVPFSAAAFREWIGDRLDVFNGALDAIMGWYAEHRAQMESVPGK